MKAIILAAGEGKRMRPLTLETVKPMIEILGKPILHHLIDSLPKEITELIIVIGYKGEQIRAYFGDSFEGRKINYVSQEKPLGTGHALMLCKDFILPGEKFLFMLGDDLHSSAALKKILNHEHAVLVHTHAEPHRFGVIQVDSQNRVIGFEETPLEPKSNLVSLGVFVLTDKVFSYPMTLSRTGEYWSTDQIRAMMNDVIFLAEPSDFWLPIGRPSDLEVGEKALGARNEKLDVPVVILAGGKGTRLPAQEQDKPKCLVEIAGKPILAWQLDEIRKQGLHNITLALGYKAEMVVDWLKESDNADVKYVVEPEPLGTGGAIKFASEGITTPFIAMNCDDIADVSFASLIRHSCGDKFNVISGMRCEDARTFGLIRHDENKKISGFDEKKPDAQGGIVSIGRYYLLPEIFNNTPKKFSIEKDIFPKLAQEGKLVLHSHTGTYWLTVNSPEQLALTREYFSKK
jgi:NDP-sugar pyrophosphorylase family protein